MVFECVAAALLTTQKARKPTYLSIPIAHCVCDIIHICIYNEMLHSYIICFYNHINNFIRKTDKKQIIDADNTSTLHGCVQLSHHMLLDLQMNRFHQRHL